jgi:hypothetical protein
LLTSQRTLTRTANPGADFAGILRQPALDEQRRRVENSFRVGDTLVRSTAERSLSIDDGG